MIIPEKLIEILLNIKSVVVLTGAGVSAESGVKTFRDPDGLWAKFNPAELASVNGFMSNPKLVWQWYQERRNLLNNVSPNPGHFAITEMELMFPQFTLITQNVDKLHHRAGSSNPIELHGNIVENRCFDCSKPYHGETTLPDYKVPHCEHCGGLIRPCVVWFGEMLPPDALHQSEFACENCDVLFSVGTSGEVYPAAGLPLLAKRYGAVIIEVNPNPTSISYQMDYILQGTSSQVLPELVKQIKSAKKNS